MKIVFIEDVNGEFFSEDKKRRFTRLVGAEAYEYLKSAEGKSKHFYRTQTEEQDGDMVLVEVPLSKVKDVRKEQRHEQYVADCIKEKDFTLIHLSDMDSDDGIMGAELLPSPDDGIDKLVLRNLQHEVLHKALLSLEKDELEIVNKMFYNSSPMSERELAASLGIAKSTLHDRKIAVFKKIRKIFEESKL